MSTFAQMTTRVRSLCGNHSRATTAVVGEFVNSRHRALLESYDWSRRKNDIVIVTQIDKTAGTVTVTNGSSAVTGSATSWAAGDVGRSIKIGDSDSIYTVRSVGGATALVLGDANGTEVLFPGDSASGLSYEMFTQRYSLGTGIEQIIGVKYQTPLTEVSEEFLDRMDPTRQGTASAPTKFARVSRGSSDDVRIEVHPRPSTAIAINVKIQKGHTDLSGAQTPLIPSGPIEWFAAVDTCFFLYAVTEDDKWLRLADKYEKHGAKAEEFEHNEDNKKFGQIQATQDVGGSINLGNTDFGLDRDTGVN